MRSSLLILLLSFLIAGLTAEFSNAQNSSEDVQKAIQKNFQLMGEAMASGNADALALHFTEDAFLKFPEKEPITGRQAIADAHRQMIEQGIGIKPNTQEVQAFGDIAYEIGTYEILNKDGHIIDKGHYASIWEKEEGSWKISRDMISSTKEAPKTEDGTTANKRAQNRAAIESVLDLYFHGLLTKNMELIPLAQDVLFVGPTGYTLQGIADVTPFLANTAEMVTDIHVKKTVIEEGYACKVTDYDWTNEARTPLAICFGVEDNEITEIRPYFDPKPIMDN